MNETFFKGCMAKGCRMGGVSLSPMKVLTHLILKTMALLASRMPHNTHSFNKTMALLASRMPLKCLLQFQ
jgi:hypothetical protein